MKPAAPLQDTTLKLRHESTKQVFEVEALFEIYSRMVQKTCWTVTSFIVIQTEKTKKWARVKFKIRGGH